MASMLTFFEVMDTLPVALWFLPSFSELMAIRLMFSVRTEKLLPSTSLPSSSIIETPILGVRILMPASRFVCRLPSPSAVATLMLSAVICIEAPVVFCLKSSPALIVPFSVSKAFFFLLASASCERVFTYVMAVLQSMGKADST